MYKNFEIETIYIGGGNPSLNPENLKEINKIINLFFTLNSIKEYTVECNPLNVTKNFIEILKEISCNRVSLGIQSFTEKTLKYANRLGQTNETVFNALSLLNKEKISISIDLINGLPYADFDKEFYYLEKLLGEFENVNHISLYDLSIDKGSKFYDYKNLKMLSESKKDKYEKQFRKIIDKFGFKRYEVSNYCKKNKMSLHNLGYWKYNNYLGLGPSAHSTIDNLRMENKPELDKYILGIDFTDKYVLNKKQQIEEYLLMGLRLTEGINLNNFFNRFNLDFFTVFKMSLEKNIRLKNLVIKNNYLHTTNRGINFLNSILVDLFDDLDLLVE